MSVKVITYAHPLELERLKEFEPYRNSPHFCATDSLRKGVIHYYGTEGQTPLLKGPIVGAGLVMERLLDGRSRHRRAHDGWTQEETKMFQYAQLTGIWNTLKEASGEADQKQWWAFRRNQHDVLKTMRTLAEIGLKPQDLEYPEITKEEQRFIELWTEMERTNRDFQKIRETFRTTLADPETMRDRLREAVESIPVKSNSESKSREPKYWKVEGRIETVVLHGFYFITPIQYKFFSLMREAGIELVFLNLYDKNYPSTFESVDGFLKGLIKPDQWYEQEPSDRLHPWGMRFASAFEKGGSGAVLPADNPPAIKAYKDFYAMLETYKDEPNGDNGQVEYCSPSHETINERLKEYFPDNFKDRHFLAYPVGQFLFHLHNMWEERRGEIVINERSLYECFASGWLQAGESKAVDYTHVLREILPYFADAQTLSEWRDQQVRLRQIKQNAVQAFVQSKDTDLAHRRFHEMMENPLLRFSFLNVTDEELNAVFELMDQLFLIAEDLFQNQGMQVELAEHFAKVNLLIQKRNQDPNLLPQEQELLRRVQERLLSQSGRNGKFWVQDLSDAIALYLNGAFKKPDAESTEDDEDQGQEQHQHQADQGGPFKQFADLDAAAFFADKRYHVACLDEESLPFNQASLPWPLTRSCLEAQSQSDELQTILMRETFSPAIARYLLYSVLAFNEKVTFSWMRNWQDKELQESPYLMLLELEPDEEESGGFENLDVDAGMPMDAEKEAAIAHMAHYPPDAHAEYALCSRRFYYSFLTQKFASFRDEFHHQFLFGNLLKVTVTLSEQDDETVFDQVSYLFPQWTELKRKDLAENAFDYRSTVDTKFESYDGREYMGARKSFQFLLNKREMMEEINRVFNASESAAEQHFNKMRLDDELQMEANPSDLCRYCPHLPICKDGNYPVDDRSRS